MYSEENEMIAEAAYARFRADHDPSLPEWAAYQPKHIWRDLVQTFERNPRSHIAIANPMEQCVSDVLTEKATGAIPTPASAEPAIEEPTPKPKTTKPKK